MGLEHKVFMGQKYERWTLIQTVYIIVLAFLISLKNILCPYPEMLPHGTRDFIAMHSWPGYHLSLTLMPNTVSCSQNIQFAASVTINNLTSIFHCVCTHLSRVPLYGLFYTNFNWHYVFSSCCCVLHHSAWSNEHRKTIVTMADPEIDWSVGEV